MRPAIIFLAVLATTLFCIQQGIGCSARKKERVHTNTTPTQPTVTVITPTLTPECPPTPVPASTTPLQVVSNGWKFDYKGVDYEWQVPTTPATEPTAWLNLDHNFNYRQRIKEDCIIEYDASGTKKSMLYEVKSEQVYLIGEDGKISTSPWGRKDFDDYRLTTTAVRFIPYEGKPIALKIGRKE